MGSRIRPAKCWPALAVVAVTVLPMLVVAAPAVGQDSDEQITIELRAGTTPLSGGRRWDDSGVTGTATLTAAGEQTVVRLQLRGVTGEHPDHIHRGNCADPEPQPLYPLTDVVLNPTNALGLSETVVDVPLSELLAEDHLILIHMSSEDLNTYLACGDIAPGAAGGAQMPDAGVGAAVPVGRGEWAMAVGLGAVVAALALFGLALRRPLARR